MLTTLLVSAGSKVLGAFGQNKKSTSSSSGSGTTTPTADVPAGMTMRSGTVLEKNSPDSIEIDEG